MEAIIHGKEIWFDRVIVIRSFLLEHDVVPRDHPTFFHRFLFLNQAAHTHLKLAIPG